MKKICYLINAFYPDNPGESFLANELDYLNRFDKLIIVPLFANPNDTNRYQYRQTKQVKLDVFRIAKFGTIDKIIGAITTCAQISLYRELWQLYGSKRLTVRNIRKAISFMAQGRYYSKAIAEDIEKNTSQDDEILVYSYWLNLNAYVATLVKMCLPNRKIHTVSRGHRIDIYEYANDDYIPFRSYVYKKLDMICPISDDGMNYLIEKYVIDSSKITVCRLGTSDKGIQTYVNKNVFRIVTCSWVRKVKRLDLFLDALELISFPLQWVHFGDGDEFCALVEKAKHIRNANVRCDFRGNTPNSVVLKELKNGNFNVFCNVSLSEGVPVSIMEAMSFGIPIIATDVGGSGEIVHDHVNGFLLQKECSKHDILHAINLIHDLSEDEYKSMCANSRHIWEKLCMDSKNYEKFALMLDSLISE